jgi:uncharacterized damage-inducible protein DinB
MFLPADGCKRSAKLDRILRQTIYNAWANAQVFHVVQTLSEEILMRPNGSSFPSICETVLHIWDAELIWLNRLQGKSFSTWPSKDWKREHGIAGWIECSNRLRDYCAAQQEGWWEETAHYQLLSGKGHATPHADIVMHVTNHSTFHRGQVVTMLRQAGITDLPSTDLIAFLRV